MNGDLMVAMDGARKKFTTRAVVNRVDEEGGKALLHLSQSCQRRAAISINSDDSSSEFGTVKTESLSDEPMTMENHQSTIVNRDHNNVSYTTTTSYPAYTDKPMRTVASNSNNNNYQHATNNNDNTTKTRDLFPSSTHLLRSHNIHDTAPDSGYGGDPLPRSANSPAEMLINYNSQQQQQQHRFELEAPSISTTDVGYLYEISTRLLFTTIEWVQSLDSFQRLPKEDQYNLILNKWHSLFVLGMAQSSSMFPISTMLFLANVNNNKGGGGEEYHDNGKSKESGATTTTTSPTTPLPWSTFVKLKDIVLNGGFIVQGELSRTTYDYMKMVTLFDAGTVCLRLLFVSF